MEKRYLEADEISCRVQMINENGLSLLLYVTSRAGQNILDQKYGNLNWQDHYQLIDGDLFCTISIYNKDTKEWIDKTDVGTANYTEKEKSRASDAFKRACVKVGIARELYSAPFIWITKEQANIKTKNNKYITTDTFEVKDIDYSTDGNIVKLEIINSRTGDTVYKKYPDKIIGLAQLRTLEKMIKEAEIEKETVLDYFKIDTFEKINTSTFIKICNKLQKTIESKGEK